MSATQSALGDFAAAAQARFGAAEANEEGVFVAVGERTVHVTLDAGTGRAVVWTELARPDHADFAELERAAKRFNGARLVETGLALNVNRAADLLLLGRSRESDALAGEDGLDVVARVAETAPEAERALAAPADGEAPRRPAPALHESMFIRI